MLQLLSGSVTRGSAGSDEPGSGGVGFATRDRFSSFVFNEKSVFSASRIAVTFAAFAARDLILKVHLRTFNVRVPIGKNLKLLSDFVTHSRSCWSCCLQVPILRRPAPRTSFLERVGLHPVIICTLVLRAERTCCDCGFVYQKTLTHSVELLTRAPSLSSVYQKLCS